MKDKSKVKEFNYDSNIAIYFRIVKEVFLPNAHWFIIALIFMSLNATSVAYRAYLIKPAVDKMFVEKNINALLYIPIQIILIAIWITITSYIEGLIMHNTTQKIFISYQRKLYTKLISCDMDYFQNKSSHKILSLFVDIGGLIAAINIILTGLIKQVLTMAGLIGLMFYQNPILSVFAFIGFPVVIGPVYKIGRKLRDEAKRGRELASDLNSTMGEALSLIELVKSNSSERHELFKFNKVINTSYRSSMNMVKRSLIAAPMMELAGSIGFAGVIWYGGKSVIDGKMTSGAFFTFLTALLSVYKPAKSFANVNITIQNALACAKRLFITLDKEPKIKDKENAIILPRVIGDIQLDNVTFNYPFHKKNEELVVQNDVMELSEKIALDNVSINIKHGKSIALVGHSGSGKSTIFKLLLRYYDPIKGSIKIDGYNLKDVTMKSLHDNISVVSQDVLIFNASVKENVKYGKFNATDDEIIKACKLAEADEFINDLENGYDTILGPNGCVLSGGQKQRISIARAILKNTPILLLDEATSALDPITEKLIQKALNTLMKDKTTIIIAHRLTTVQNCDQIFVLQEGKLMESGNHNELMNMKNGLYSTLYKKQFEKAI